MTAASAAAKGEFIRLTTDAERKTFYAELPAPRWWTGGKKKSCTFGWLEAFEASEGKCVYCGRDLATSTDALAESTEEHLVPRSLLKANGVPAETEHNMATCCAGCNGLKAEFVPQASHPCWKNRKDYIKECARYVAGLRLKNFQKYSKHVEKVLKKRAGVQ